MNGRNGRFTHLVDSNIFLRVIVRDDARTWQDCFNVLTAIGESRVDAYMPAIIPAEVHYVLQSFYRFEKVAITEALKGIASMANLQIFDDLSLPLAVQLFEDHHVKFVDCLLASSKRIQEGRAVILSYDRDFDKLKVRRLEPSQLLKKLKP